MKKLFFITFFLCAWAILYCQEQQGLTQEPSDYKLFVTLENAPFDSLYVYDYTFSVGRRVYIEGKKFDKFSWEFTIPDSIAWNSEIMVLKLSKSTNKLHHIRFFTEKEISFANIGIEDKINYIHAVYLKQSVYPNNVYSRVKIANRDTVILVDVICEDCELILKNDSSGTGSLV